MEVAVFVFNTMFYFFTLKIIEGAHERDGEEAEGGAVVAVLASQQCDPRSIPGSSDLCWLSLFLVPIQSSLLRGFYSGFPVFLLPQKPTL